MDARPAWSPQFAADTLKTLAPVPPLDDITPEWAWGGSTGAGVKMAVIDSGIDAEHPAVGGHLGGYVVLTDGLLGLLHDTEPHGDSYGHGTACAGIIRSVAPGCELYSVKVLGSRLTGGATFAAGLRWAIENGMDVCNVSMGTTKKIFFAAPHDLADKAYFRNTVLVTAANNMPAPSFPSLYSSVVSGASHDGKDPTSSTTIRDGIYGADQPGSVPFPVVLSGISNWLWVPALGLPGTYLLLLFPDGRLPSRRWRSLAWLSGVVLVLASVGGMLSPGPLDNLGGAQPVRDRGVTLGDYCIVYCSPAAAPVHARLGSEPGIALPAFWGRGAPADQVDSLRRLGRGSGIPEQFTQRAHLRTRNAFGCRRHGAVVG